MDINYEEVTKLIDEYIEMTSEQPDTTLLLIGLKQEIEGLMYVTQTKRIGMYH